MFSSEVGDQSGHSESSHPFFCPTTVCPLIVQRSAWDAREAHCPEMNQPAQYVIIIHTAGRTCNRSDECRVLVQDIQSSFMDRLDSCDIGYK